MSKSPQPKPKVNGAVNGPPDSTSTGVSQHKLDIQKLHSLPSEQQDLYLFTFISELEGHISSLDHDGVCSEQLALKEELFQIVDLSAPAPTRVIRNNLGRCFAHILDKGDRKPLYESVNRLLAIINAGKNDKESQNRHAAVFCLGEVYKTAGDSAITLSNFACSSLIRLSKLAQNHAGLRAAISRALGNIVFAVRGSLDEAVARDIWKYARSVASNDKAGLVQAKGCAALEQLIRFTDYFESTSDFESLKTTLWKVTDSPIPAARHAAAACLAAALLKAHSESSLSKSVPKVKKPKKPAKKEPSSLEDREEERPRAESPRPRKAASAWS